MSLREYICESEECTKKKSEKSKESKKVSDQVECPLCRSKKKESKKKSNQVHLMKSKKKSDQVECPLYRTCCTVTSATCRFQGRGLVL